MVYSDQTTFSAYPKCRAPPAPQGYVTWMQAHVLQTDFPSAALHFTSYMRAPVADQIDWCGLKCVFAAQAISQYFTMAAPIEARMTVSVSFEIFQTRGNPFQTC